MAIYTGSVGVEIQLTVVNGATGSAINLASCSKITVFLKKPSGTLVERHALPVTDLSDGKIKYISQSGDFDEAGPYQIQPIIRGLSLWSGPTEPYVFSVSPALDYQAA